MKGRGLFVVFEGGDGVGKTTQLDLLCARLKQDGYDFVRTFEPGDTTAGQQIRTIVLSPATGDLAPRAEALLYAADKAHHLYTVVEPALDRGAIVVCDRYVDSMLAYQGAGRILDVDEVERIARWATGDLRPDLTILLDADPGQAVTAISDKDRVEAAGDEFHQLAREYFLTLAKRDPDSYLVLDARASREEIAADIFDRLQVLLSERTDRLAL